jgi:hypothetical protein
MCPIPPCDLKSFDHPLCDHYLCRGGGHHKECTFIGNCNGNSDCIATAQYLDLDADYYADEEESSTADYSGNYNESYNEKTGGGLYEVTSTQNWLVYGVLGGTLAAFMMMVIWRRRVSSSHVARGYQMAFDSGSNSLVLLHSRPLTMMNSESSLSLMAKISTELLLATMHNHKLPWYNNQRENAMDERKLVLRVSFLSPQTIKFFSPVVSFVVLQLIDAR